MEFFNYITIPWDKYVLPGDCLAGGLAIRLLLRGTLPLLLIILVIPLNVLRVLTVHVVSGARGVPPLYSKGIIASLPYMLFIAFLFCVSVSSGLFAAWSCDYFEVDRVYGPDGQTSTPVMRGFLRDDLRIECDYGNAEVCVRAQHARRGPPLPA